MMSEKDCLGFVSLVGAGPGDPGLITLHGVERLAQAEVVVYDRLANPLLLRIASQAELIPVGKQPDHHPIPQKEINNILAENARQGKRVVRLKGGDPFVFGRGGEEALALRDAGIDFEIVPGITSAIAAPAYAGIPVTHRELSGSVVFITGHRTEGSDDPESGWLRNCQAADTLVFLMGVKNLPRIVAQILSAGWDTDTPAALIQWGTLPNQKTICGTLSNIVEKAIGINPPAVCVVGEVVRLRDQLRWFDTLEYRPLFGLRVLNTKTISQEDDIYITKGIPLLDDFDKQVTALGAQIIHMPILQVVPPTSPEFLLEAIRGLVTGQVYNWVVFTSTNGVDAVFNQLGILGYDSRYLKGVRIAAIGQITAQALHQRGIYPDFIPTSFTGVELGNKLPFQPGEKILLPRSEIALSELPQILRARGGVVYEVNAYSVKTNSPDRVVFKQLFEKQIDIIAFFSPSGLYGFSEMLVETGHTTSLKETLDPITIACIGPTTEKAAQELGLRVDVVAQKHSSIGLVQELKKWRKHL